MNALTTTFTIWGALGALLSLNSLEASTLTDAQVLGIFTVLTDTWSERSDASDFVGQALVGDLVEALELAEITSFDRRAVAVVRRAASAARDHLHSF